MDALTRSSDFYPCGGRAPSYSTTAGPQHPSSAIYSQAQNSSRRYNGETRPPFKLQPSRPSLTPHKLTNSPAAPSNANMLSLTASVSDFSTASGVKPPTTLHPTPPRLSQPEMAAAIKSFLEQETPLDSMELGRLSWEEFEKLREKVASIPGWNKVSVDFIKNKKCIIQYSGPGHEIMNSIFIRFFRSGMAGSEAANDLEGGGHINSLGSADIELVDGLKKAPDFSFSDSDPNIPLDARSFPTIIWEVALTEPTAKLAVDCGRFIACSKGCGLLAIGIDIKHDKDGGLPSVRCSIWELEEGKIITPWPPTHQSHPMFGRELDMLYRSDTDDTESVLEPATSFYCISQLGPLHAPETIAFYAKEVQNFAIFPEDEATPSGIKILHRHWYRLPDEATADKTLFEIPCSLIVDVVLRHENVAAHRKLSLKRKNTSDAGVSLLDLFTKRIKLAKAPKSKIGQGMQSNKGPKGPKA